MARKKKLPDEPVTEDAAEQEQITAEVVEEPDAAQADTDTSDDLDEAQSTEDTAEGDLSDADAEEPIGSDTMSEDAIAADAADPEAPVEASVPQTVVTKKTGFFPTLLGGVICAALGYGAAQYIKPEGWPFPGASNADTAAQIAALEEQLSTLQDALAAQSDVVNAAQASLADTLDERLSALDFSDQLAPLSGQVEEIGERMTALEARPVAEAVLSEEAARAYESQFEEMRATISDEVTRLTTAQTEAKAATAIAALRERIDLGEPFATVLAELEGDIPAGLTTLANTGVPSLASLQDSFPAAARATVVIASRDAYESGEQGFVQNFLFTQLGMRSTQPKDGYSADAVLSRAEQALRNGKVSDALATLDALPESAKGEMANWAEDAGNRVTALDALSELIAQ